MSELMNLPRKSSYPFRLRRNARPHFPVRGDRMRSKNAMVIAVVMTATALLGFGIPAVGSSAAAATTTQHAMAPMGPCEWPTCWGVPQG